MHRARRSSRPSFATPRIVPSAHRHTFYFAADSVRPSSYKSVSNSLPFATTWIRSASGLSSKERRDAWPSLARLKPSRWGFRSPFRFGAFPRCRLRSLKSCKRSGGEHRCRLAPSCSAPLLRTFAEGKCHRWGSNGSGTKWLKILPNCRSGWRRWSLAREVARWGVFPKNEWRWRMPTSEKSLLYWWMFSIVIGSSTQNTWLVISKVLFSSLLHELYTQSILIAPQESSLLNWINKNGVIGKSILETREQNQHDGPLLQERLIRHLILEGDDVLRHCGHSILFWGEKINPNAVDPLNFLEIKEWTKSNSTANRNDSYNQKDKSGDSTSDSSANDNKKGHCLSMRSKREAIMIPGQGIYFFSKLYCSWAKGIQAKSNSVKKQTIHNDSQDYCEPPKLCWIIRAVASVSIRIEGFSSSYDKTVSKRFPSTTSLTFSLYFSSRS